MEREKHGSTKDLTKDIPTTNMKSAAGFAAGFIK
jgi:hypothetical protein